MNWNSKCNRNISVNKNSGRHITHGLHSRSLMQNRASIFYISKNRVSIFGLLLNNLLLIVLFNKKYTSKPLQPGIFCFNDDFKSICWLESTIGKSAYIILFLSIVVVVCACGCVCHRPREYQVARLLVTGHWSVTRGNECALPASQTMHSYIQIWYWLWCRRSFSYFTPPSWEPM